MGDRVFLDANVLFSASYVEHASLLRLWSLSDTEICTSSYAALEAQRNVVSTEQAERLAALLEKTEIIHYDAPGTGVLFASISLPDKDWPIMLAALEGGCTHLLTGDKKHFGEYLDAEIEGLIVQLPGTYLRQRLAEGGGDHTPGTS